MRERLVYVDEFGDRQRDRWDAALQEFVREKMRGVQSVQRRIDEDEIDTVMWVVEDMLDEKQQGVDETPAAGWRSVESHNSLEFEEYCRRVFEECGFEAARTGGSGDQGADVIAAISDFRVAVQCKLHARSIGNEAVQQAEAARQFYDCSTAMVVSNSGFTTSARVLAGKLRVQLVDASELRTAIRSMTATV